jgi:Flp pilus assembly protein TadG
MRRLCGQLCRDQCATTAIEFAIIAPLLFAILFGIIGFGVQYATRIALTYAATEGGRAAVVGLSDQERTSLAKTAIANTLNALSPLVDPSKSSVSVDFTEEVSGERIAVTISYNDTRFAELPYLPNLGNLNPVTVDFYVTDPSN